MKPIIRVVAFALSVLISAAACTRSASTPIQPPSAATIQARETIRASQQTETPEATSTATEVPPSPTAIPPTATASATPAPLFADVLNDDVDWAAFERAYTLRWIRPCQEEPLSLCPEGRFFRSQAFESMIMFIHGPDFEPPKPTGFFWDLPYTSIFDDPERVRVAAFAEQLWRENYMRGCSTARPESCFYKPLTREESTVFLVRLLHPAEDGEAMYEPPSSPGCFSDVIGRWSSRWVCTFATSVFYDVVAEGLEEFNPIQPVTVRQWIRWLNTAYEQGFGSHQ